MWGAAAPWIISGGSALANYLGGGRGGQTEEEVSGYGQSPFGYDEGLHPELAMAKGLANVENLGAILAERAAQPASLPGAFVQPLPSYYGGGLPGVIGPPALDPALIRPGAHLTRPGVRFQEPALRYDTTTEEFTPRDYFGPAARGYHPDTTGRSVQSGKYDQPQPRELLFPGGARTLQPHQQPGFDPAANRHGGFPENFEGVDYFGGSFRGAEQPGPPSPAVGGGFKEIAEALQYLGVEQDPFGYFVQGKDFDIFAGRGDVNFEGRLPLGDDYPTWTRPGDPRPDPQPQLQTPQPTVTARNTGLNIRRRRRGQQPTQVGVGSNLAAHSYGGGTTDSTEIPTGYAV
jgi:hypothetical protein